MEESRDCSGNDPATERSLTRSREPFAEPEAGLDKPVKRNAPSGGKRFLLDEAREDAQAARDREAGARQRARLLKVQLGQADRAMKEQYEIWSNKIKELEQRVVQDVTMSDRDNELEALQEAHRSQMEQIVQQQHRLDKEQEMHRRALQQTQQEFEKKLADVLQKERAEAQRILHEGLDRQRAEAEKAFEDNRQEWEKRMNEKSAEVLAIHQRSQSRVAASSLSPARRYKTQRGATLPTIATVPTITPVSPVPPADPQDGPVNPAATPTPPIMQDSTVPASPAAVPTPPSLADISTPKVKVLLCKLLSAFGLTTVPEQATDGGPVRPVKIDDRHDIVKTTEGNIEFGVEKQEDFGAYTPADEELVSAYDNGRGAGPGEQLVLHFGEKWSTSRWNTSILNQLVKRIEDEKTNNDQWTLADVPQAYILERLRRQLRKSQENYIRCQSRLVSKDRVLRYETAQEAEERAAMQSVTVHDNACSRESKKRVHVLNYGVLLLCLNDIQKYLRRQGVFKNVIALKSVKGEPDLEMWEKLQVIFERLDNHCMSSEEYEVDEIDGRETEYFAVKLCEWRHEDVTGMLHTIDKMGKAEALRSEKGSKPAPRILDTNRFTTEKAPTGLPQAFYNPSWIQKQGPHVIEELRISKEVFQIIKVAFGA
ncbi:hypothetical protein IW261DRAFT_1573227 [Armillaria novae-zelandiae]|uniref:Uncharacterized protein n=1 Tax=Armillaria novae-zelandiae TaxID=153914 RepID=A0AA39NNJ0_9AGAR|nr:hypothetical protein IW261DRAFT_1573227 [Armillaria novae-zelandiae]